MVADKGKKLKIEERDEEESSDDIDESIFLTIEKLQDLQDELEKVNEEACEKILEVEQKYSEIRRPVYSKREEVIKAIPDFWSTAFLSHPSLDEFLRPEDQKVFEYLISLEVEEFKDVKSGYSITFNFKPNPYFEDTKLFKTYFFPENEMTKVTGSTIKWKKGMDITQGVNHEKKGSKRPYVDDRRSFFCWFSDSKPDDIVEVSDSEGWVVPSLHVGGIIKEELWPNPLKYYSCGSDEEDSGENEDEEDVDESDDDDAEDENGNEEDDT